jgi:hypothetical protein
MEETTITIDRLNDGAEKLAKAIRQGHRATSDVSIPIAFEEIRLAVEERFEEINRLKETKQPDASTQKYEFTGETKDIQNCTVRQIRRISDGEIGGWIESEKNLSHEGDCWIGDNACVYGDANVSGNSWVSGNAKVYGDANVYGNACVFGDSYVFGNALVSGNAWVFGNAKVHGDAWVSGNAYVYGDAKVYGGVIR